MRRSVLARSGCFHFSPALKRELSLRRKTFPLLGYFCQSFVNRSEEHTSELQSQSNLVCRLLLEKKKKKIKHTLLLLKTFLQFASKAIQVIRQTPLASSPQRLGDISMFRYKHTIPSHTTQSNRLH